MATSKKQDDNSYFICRAKVHHISALNAIELAAATIFPPGSIPEHILTDRIPLDVLMTAQKENMLWIAVDMMPLWAICFYK